MGTLLLLLQANFPPPPAPPPPGVPVDEWLLMMLFVGIIVYLIEYKRRKI